MKILFVEDNPTIAKGLCYSLAQNHYDTIWVDSCLKAKEVLSKNVFDLLLLDVTLPDGNGFQLYQEIQDMVKIPTIFLTAKDEEEDVICGLELGADDYITKPFSTKEVLLRISKILSRQERGKKVIIEVITFDVDKQTVYSDVVEIVLTSLERKILFYLIQNKNKVVTRESLLDKIWEWTGNDVEDNTITVYMKRIRKKLEKEIIITLKGMGYRIDE